MLVGLIRRHIIGHSSLSYHQTYHATLLGRLVSQVNIRLSLVTRDGCAICIGMARTAATGYVIVNIATRCSLHII